MLLLNAFSLNMLGEVSEGRIHFRRIDLAEARRLAHDAESAVGHDDTARLYSSLLDRVVPCVRETVRLEPGDEALIGQYLGPRLPPGARDLPRGARIQWYVLRIQECPSSPRGSS
jgi:hypothetical protein